MKALTLRFAAARDQDPSRGPSWEVTENVGATAETWDLGLGYSHEGENQCTLYVFGPLGWLEAGLCLPMYGKSPEGLYTSTLHGLLPLSYPGVKADVYLQCLTTLVMGGNGLSRPGGNLGFRILGFRV